MKYRIKITTYKNGRKDYKPQVKTSVGWAGIASDGEHSYYYDHECNTREKALERIDLHFDGNKKKQTIEFEYIEKEKEENLSDWAKATAFVCLFCVVIMLILKSCSI